MRINDIPQFPKSNWSVDVAWRDLLPWVDRHVREDGLVLEPDFQRGHVWVPEQRIRYVEYVLRGGEGGKDLCFNRPNWNGRGECPDGLYEILDGLQRLTSAMMFMRGELPAFGRRLSEYEDRDALRYYLGFKWRIFELPTRADVLRYYLDMNAGGTPHAESEITRVRGLLEAELAGATPARPRH